VRVVENHLDLSGDHSRIDRYDQRSLSNLRLSRVRTQVVDVSGGLPGLPSNYMLYRWAVKNQEVLILNEVPRDAIIRYYPPIGVR
jgi:hypothetical protein